MSRAATERQFQSVTEQPGQHASRLQLEMMAARYAWARSRSIGKDVLEVACGSGTGLAALAAVARTVEASDVDHTNLRAAQQHYGQHSNIHIQYADALQLPYPDASFDTVLLFEAIYYLGSAKRFFDEALRVLRPGGRLLVATVNREWTGFNASPLSIRYYSASDLEAELRLAGFRTSLQVGFPEQGGLLATLVRAIRRAAVALNIVPRTMAGKARLKRIFYGQLEPIPAQLDLRQFTIAPFESVTTSTDLTRFRVLYAEASN